MKIYSFPRGGLLYADSTAPEKTVSVNSYLPVLAIIPLQDRKRKVYPIVPIGEIVREGMIIGKAASGKSGIDTGNVHASIPGRVLRKVSWNDREGYENEGLLIKLEGSFDKLGKREEVFQWKSLGGYDLQRIIAECGVTEMENSGRSISDMISSSRRENEKLALVVRCVFDDPWLAADYVLCKERINAVIEGAAIVAKACFKVQQVIFAVSSADKELADLFTANASIIDFPSSLVLTGSRYPQRNNRELEIALRLFEKKEGLNLGNFLILGPAALAASYDAVVHKKPVLDRYVAVGGAAVKRPQILKARIGTKIGELIEQCGGFIEDPVKIICGSPLSGREVMYLDEPVTKSCYAIVAMTKSQAGFHKQQNCINCGECRTVCPVGLDPQNIYKRIQAMEIENAGITGCQGCGCCRIVCPSGLPLLETILEKNQEAAGA